MREASATGARTREQEYQHNYRLAHKAEKRAKELQGFAEHPERLERKRAANRAWHAAHREQVRQRHAEWMALNSEMKRLSDKVYREGHVDKIREYQRGYEAGHRDRIRAKHQDFYDSRPEYRSWTGAKDRTTNPGCHNWQRYGGRGISICQRWLESFEAFLEDMGPKPEGMYSLDRIDPDGNYEPGNCRWATPLGQRHNRSRART